MYLLQTSSAMFVFLAFLSSWRKQGSVTTEYQATEVILCESSVRFQRMVVLDSRIWIVGVGHENTWLAICQ